MYASSTLCLIASFREWNGEISTNLTRLDAKTIDQVCTVIRFHLQQGQWGQSTEGHLDMYNSEKTCFCVLSGWLNPRLAFTISYHNKLWKILQEMGISDHLTYLLRNLYAGQEATVRTGHEKTDWFQIRKGVLQGCMLSPCLLTYIQSTSCKTLGWMKPKLESRLPGEISITSDTQMTLSYGRKWRRTKEPLDESERGEWKSWL